MPRWTADRLGGRRAIVTGGAGGIGRAISMRLAEEGCRVAVLDIDNGAAAATVASIRSRNGFAVAIQADVASPTILEEALPVAEDGLGGLVDAVVCNAGVQSFRSVWDLDPVEWESSFATNAVGPFLLMRQAALRLIEHDRGGAFVTVSSVKASTGALHFAHYSASKAALINITKSLALALAGENIRVNAVAPGAIDTALWRRSESSVPSMTGQSETQYRQERIDLVPLKRLGTPEDVAGAVSFLVSDDAAYITGETITVSGGDLMR